MLLTRAGLVEGTGATEHELSEFERQRLIVPVRSWRDFWLKPRYTIDQLRVVRWLLSCRRSTKTLERRGAELIP